MKNETGWFVPRALREILGEHGISVINLQTTFGEFWERLAALLLTEEAVTEDTVILAGRSAWNQMAEEYFAPPSREALAAIAHDKKRGAKSKQFVSLQTLASEAGTTSVQLRAWHRRKQIDLSYRGGPFAAGNLSTAKVAQLERAERAQRRSDDDDDAYWSGPGDA